MTKLSWSSLLLYSIFSYPAAVAFAEGVSVTNIAAGDIAVEETVVKNGSTSDGSTTNSTSRNSTSRNSTSRNSTTGGSTNDSTTTKNTAAERTAVQGVAAAQKYPLELRTNLEEVYVTVKANNSDFSAASHSRLDAKQLFQTGAIDIPDALATLPNVSTVSFSSSGKRTNLDIRGSGDTSVSNVAVIVDGVRVGVRDLSGTDFSSIPISRIKQIDVIRGANTVRYGSGAAQGVVEITSRSIDDTPNLELSHLLGDFGQRQTEIQTSGTSRAVSGIRHGFIAYQNVYNSEGYREHDSLDSKNTDLHYQIRTGFNEANRENQNLSIDAKYKKYQDNYQLPGPLPILELENGTIDPRSASTGSLLGGSVEQQSIAIDIKSNLSKTFGFLLSVNETHRDDDIFTDTQAAQQLTHGLLSSFVQTAKAEFQIAANNLIQHIGFEFEEQDIHRVDTLQAGSPELGVDSRIQAGYYQIRWKPAPISPLELTLGYRRDKTSLLQKSGPYLQGVTDSENYSWRNEAFEFSSAIDVYKSGDFYFGVARTFRNPNADELVFSNDSAPFPVNSVLIFGDLQPQRAERYNIGYRHYTSIFHAELNLFKSKTSNEIILRNGSSGNAVNGNLVEPVKRQGAEFSLGVQVNKYLAFSMSAGLQRAKLQNSSRIPLVPEENFTFSASGSPLKNLDLSVTHRFVGTRLDGNDFENIRDDLRLDSHQLTNMSVSYSPHIDSETSAVFYLQVENLFNERYLSASYSGAAYPQASRMLRGGVRLRI